MDGNLQNDLSEVVANDKAHVWHHLIQHKMFETADPNVIVEGKGMRVWNQLPAKNISMRSQAAFGPSMLATGVKASPTQYAINW